MIILGKGYLYRSAFDYFYPLLENDKNEMTLSTVQSSILPDLNLLTLECSQHYVAYVNTHTHVTVTHWAYRRKYILFYCMIVV